MSDENRPALPEEPSSPSPTDSSSLEADGFMSPEDIEKLPPGVRRIVQRSVSASFVGRLPNPIVEKLTPEHITSLITAADKDRDRNLEDRKHSRKWQAIIVALLVIPIAALLGYFAYLQQNALVLEIIKLAAVAVGGFGVGLGYGFTRWRNNQ